MTDLSAFNVTGANRAGKQVSVTFWNAHIAALEDAIDAAAASAGAGIFQPLDSDLTAIAALATTAYGRSLLVAADAPALRTLAGTVIDTDVQAYNANLTTFAGIAPSTNVQTLLGSADYSAFRTSLGLVIGTNVQAYNANLTTYAGIAPSANVQTLLGAASFAAFRTSLGTGTGDSPQFTAVNIGDASDTTLARSSAGNLSVEGNLIYRAGGTDVPVADGGTGASDASTARTNLGVAIGSNVQAWDADLDDIAGLADAQGDVLIRGASGWERLGPGTSGQFLKTQGAAANPIWASAGTAGVGGSGWTLISSTSPSGASSVDVNGLANYNEVLVVARALTASISGVRRVQVSTDNGSSFYNGASDYIGLTGAGIESNAATPAIGFHDTNATAARTLQVHIVNTKGAVKRAFGTASSPGGLILFVGSASDINAIRVDNHTGGTISGGPVYVYAR